MVIVCIIVFFCITISFIEILSGLIFYDSLFDFSLIRDLETELSIKVIDLVFPQGVDSSKCSALLVETLPPGLYADPFQLSWLFDNNGATQVCYCCTLMLMSSFDQFIYL